MHVVLSCFKNTENNVIKNTYSNHCCARNCLISILRHVSLGTSQLTTVFARMRPSVVFASYLLCTFLIFLVPLSARSALWGGSEPLPRSGLWVRDLWAHPPPDLPLYLCPGVHRSPLSPECNKRRSVRLSVCLSVRLFVCLAKFLYIIQKTS